MHTIRVRVTMLVLLWCMKEALSGIFGAIGQISDVIVVSRCERDRMRKRVGHAEEIQNQNM